MLASHTTQDDLALLERVSFFAHLGPDEIRALAGAARRRNYRRGDVIHHADDLAGDVFIVSRGHVKHRQTAEDGRQITHGMSGPSDAFGLMSVIDHKRRAGDAVALTDCEVLVIDRDTIRQLIERHPEANAILLEHHVASLRKTMAMVHDLAFLNVPSRLAKVLLHVARQEPDDPRGLLSVPSYLNQTELSFLVCTTRESINQWLKRFARDGSVVLERRRVLIRDPEALRRIAG